MKILRKTIKMLITISLILVLVAPTTLAESETSINGQRLQDDFSAYVAGSDGSPKWITDDISWEVNNGCFENNSLKKSFAKYDSTVGTDLTFESEVTIQVSQGDKYKSAGISVYSDNNNYWSLALVEGPEAKNKMHYIELQEMFNGQWCVQDYGETKLKVGSYVGDGIEWKYNQPYVLKISLNNKSITGVVCELDGKKIWEKEYIFSSENCTKKGIPALTSAAVETKYDNAKCTINKKVYEVNAVSSYPELKIKTDTTINGKKTGFFHTQKIGDKWWVIAPDGKGFIAVGTQRMTYKGIYSEALGYSPYEQNVKSIYGSEEEWAENTAERLNSWGFNLLGIDSAPSLRHRGLAHTVSFGFGNSFSKYGEDYVIYGLDASNHCFPNVFSPKFVYYCDDLARKVIQEDQNDPWLFGYYLDNELSWWGQSFDTTYGLTDLVIKKDKTHTAKIALINWLQNRYGNISSLNKAWGTDYTSFETLGKMTSFTGKNQLVINTDKTDFEKVIIEKYYTITTGAIKKYDKNHMILGSRNGSGIEKCYDLVWGIGRNYTDISTFNYYGKVDLQAETAYDQIKVNGVYQNVELSEIFAQIYNKAKQPIMISEWSFPAYDSGLPCTEGAGMRVDTQTERAKAYEIYQKALFNMPFLVGSEFFMWVDPPAEGLTKSYKLDTNYGLVNEKDEPYALVTSVAKATNGNVYSLRD